MTMTFKEGLRFANKTQDLYDRLDVSKTQNIRNPIPLREIINRLLPRMKPAKIWGALEYEEKYGCGYSIEVDGKHTPLNESQVAYFRENAWTIEELIQKMKESGFVVNSVRSIESLIQKMPNIQRSYAFKAKVAYFLPLE